MGKYRERVVLNPNKREYPWFTPKKRASGLAGWQLFKMLKSWEESNNYYADYPEYEEPKCSEEGCSGVLVPEGIYVVCSDCKRYEQVHCCYDCAGLS